MEKDEVAVNGQMKKKKEVAIKPRQRRFKEKIAKRNDREIRENFGANLKTAMMIKGITQTDLVRICGRSAGWLSLIINAQRTVSIAGASQLAEAVGFQIDDLVKSPRDFLRSIGRK